jgi:hypothetical protein
MLPSKVIQEASTFDLVIMDIALTFERYQHEKEQPGYIPDVGLEELLKIKERHDGLQGRNKKQ